MEVGRRDAGSLNAVRGWLVTLLVLCSCSKAEEPTPSGETASDYINIKKPPPRDRGLALLNPNDGGAFASLTGASDFSSSGGVFVSTVETPDPDEAKRLKAAMDQEIEALQPCLDDRRLALLRPSEVEFQLGMSGRASSITLPKGQQVPCLTRWLEGMNFGPPKAGTPVKVKVVLFVTRE